MTKDDPKQKLKDGWIHILVTFEIIGKPKSYVEKSLTMLIDNLRKDERVFFLEEHKERAKKDKNEYFSTFAEIDMLVKNFETLTWLGINFTPASIEVIEPTVFKMNALELQNWYNDVLSNLHNVSYTVKSQASELGFLKGSLKTLIDNTLILSLARSPKNIEQISKDTTLTADSAKAHLAKLIEEKKVKEKAGLYMLA